MRVTFNCVSLFNLVTLKTNAFGATNNKKHLTKKCTVHARTPFFVPWLLQLPNPKKKRIYAPICLQPFMSLFLSLKQKRVVHTHPPLETFQHVQHNKGNNHLCSFPFVTKSHQSRTHTHETQKRGTLPTHAAHCSEQYIFCEAFFVVCGPGCVCF